MVFFLFLASVIVLRRIVSEGKLSSVEASPDIKPSQSLSSVASPTVASPTVALPTAASTSLGRDLSQLSSVLSEWGEGAAIRKESSVSKASISKDKISKGNLAAEAKD